MPEFLSYDLLVQTLMASAPSNDQSFSFSNEVWNPQTFQLQKDPCIKDDSSFCT